MGDVTDKTRNYFYEKIFANLPAEELGEVYDEWAPSYEQGGGRGFISYPEIAKVVDKICAKLGMSKDIRILDAAAGTGFAGKALHDLGYTNLDAQDASQGMLDMARKKCIFNNYFQSYLGSSENKDLRGYDGIVCIGAFTAGHLPAEAFDDLMSFSKQGGFICFTIRDDIGGIGEAYQNKMEQFVKNKSWKQLEHVRMVYYSKTGHMCSLYVYQKC